MYNFGNCYPTKEAAKFVIEARKTYVALQRYAEEHNKELDWKNRLELKYFIAYMHLDNRLVIGDTFSSQNTGAIYFSSKAIAEAAIKAIGEDLIKKYLFGVDNHDC